MSLNSTAPPPPKESANGWGDFFHLLGSQSVQGQFMTIELSVLLTAVFLVLLFIHGGLRRRLAVAGWITTAMKGVYIVTPVMITYIIGLMHNAKALHPLFPVWALVLIYIYGGVDSLTACDLRDNEKVLQYALHILPLFFWALWLGRFFTSGASFTIPVLVLFVLATWNAKETIQALYQSSQTKGLPVFISHMVDYIRDGKAVCTDTTRLYPMPMSRYTFFVKQESGTEHATTTQDVWECKGKLLQGSRTNPARSERLKDVVLSYALGLLLLRRFARFPLHKTFDLDMLSFVRNTLLDPFDPQRVERLFRIIEVELSFVFDFFYTKHCIISSRKSFYKIRRLLCVPFFLWFGIVTLCNSKVQEGVLSELGPSFPGGRKSEILITRIVLFAIAALEILQICMYFMSYWRILFLVCDYVHGWKQHENSRKPATSIMHKALKSRLRIREMGIRCTWAMKNLLHKHTYFDFILKPWKREIGQYSFLESYRKAPILRFLLKHTVYHFLEVPRVGQVGQSRVPLTIGVKREIVSSLMHITNSSNATKARNEVPVLREASESETTAEAILIWHIATSACEHSYKPTTEPSDEFEHYIVATQISKYCAYLVTFAPGLLPDFPYNKVVFDKAVTDASYFFNKEGVKDPYSTLFSYSGSIEDGVGARNVVGYLPKEKRNVVEQAAVLARKLRDDVIGHPGRGWKAIAEKWGELLLYASLSDNATEHGVHLTRGGEFITHLWTLLTHAGIVTPQDFSAAALHI